MTDQSSRDRSETRLATTLAGWHAAHGPSLRRYCLRCSPLRRRLPGSGAILYVLLHSHGGGYGDGQSAHLECLVRPSGYVVAYPKHTFCIFCENLTVVLVLPKSQPSGLLKTTLSLPVAQGMLSVTQPLLLALLAEGKLPG